MRNEFTMVIEQDGEWLIGYCPEIPGANGQGLGQNRGRAPARAPISAHLLAQRRRLGNWCR